MVASGELRPHTRLPSEPEFLAILNISRTTIRQAWQVAEDEGLLYRVRGKGTYVAEPVATRSAQLVGFLIPDFRSSFDSDLLSGAERYLRDHSYRLVFAHTDRNVDEENRLMREMQHDGVAGFLMWPAMPTERPQFLEQFRSTPTVFMDRPIDGVAFPCVAAEHYQGGTYAVQHLINLGHTEIAFVSRPHLQLWPHTERLRAYRDTMRAAGLRPREPILVGDNTEIGLRHTHGNYTQVRDKEIDQLKAVLSQPKRPTAIFAMNDLMALQVIHAASLCQLKIPEALSLVGFDDLDLVSQIDPPLTTVAQEPFKIGMEAARCLLDMVDGQKPTSSVIYLPTRLIIRQSTARPG